MVGTSGEEVWYRSLIFHWGSAPGMEDGVHLCALSRTKDMLNELKPWLWPWVAVMLIACGEEPTERHGLAAAVLVSDTATDTITVEEAMDMHWTLQEVRSILQVIDDREHFMKGQVRLAEPSDLMRRRILYNMRLVNALVADGQAQVARARNALDAADIHDGQQRAALDTCHTRLVEKQIALKAFAAELATQGFDAEALRAKLTAMELAVAKQEALIEASERARLAAEQEVKRVWYAVGSARELRERGVISRSGAWGLLGKRQPTRDRTATFTEVQRDRLQRLPLRSKRATLLTEHPEGSYRFVVDEGRLAALEVTDSERFWAYTRYLIVEER